MYCDNTDPVPNILAFVNALATCRNGNTDTPASLPRSPTSQIHVQKPFQLCPSLADEHHYARLSEQ